MKSLWSEFWNERFGWETIEVEGGFICYDLKPPECSIEYFYIKPGLRGTPLAKRLADQVFDRARTAGAKRVWAKVVPGSAFAEHATKTNLHYGFKLMFNQGEDTIMMMETGV